MSLPSEIILQIIDEVVDADLNLWVTSLRVTVKPGMDSIGLAHCNAFLLVEVPKAFYKRAAEHPIARFDSYRRSNFRAGMRQEFDCQWSDFKAGIWPRSGPARYYFGCLGTLHMVSCAEPWTWSYWESNPG